MISQTPQASAAELLLQIFRHILAHCLGELYGLAEVVSDSESLHCLVEGDT